MANLKIYNLNKEESGVFNLNPKISEKPLHSQMIKDVVVYLNAQQRQGTHKAKTRSEVTGSRRKLFKQKGTGNARVGSVQSPIRRHGGTVFGPVPRSHEISLNKKVKKAALSSVLAESIRSNQFFIVDSLTFESHKTKRMNSFLKKWNFQKVLFITHERDKNLELASRNLPNVKSVCPKSVNVYDCLYYENIMFTQPAIEILEKRLLQ